MTANRPMLTLAYTKVRVQVQCRSAATNTMGREADVLLMPSIGSYGPFVFGRRGRVSSKRQLADHVTIP